MIMTYNLLDIPLTGDIPVVCCKRKIQCK